MRGFRRSPLPGPTPLYGDRREQPSNIQRARQSNPKLDSTATVREVLARRAAHINPDVPGVTRSLSARNFVRFGINDGLSYSDERIPPNGPSRESGRDRKRVRMRTRRARRSHARMNGRIFASKIAREWRCRGREIGVPRGVVCAQCCASASRALIGEFGLSAAQSGVLALLPLTDLWLLSIARK